MDVEYLQMLMATAEEMLVTASTLPESASRNDALQMVRAYLSNIALLMNAGRAWPKGSGLPRGLADAGAAGINS